MDEETNQQLTVRLEQFRSNYLVVPLTSAAQRSSISPSVTLSPSAIVLPVPTAKNLPLLQVPTTASNPQTTRDSRNRPFDAPAPPKIPAPPKPSAPPKSSARRSQLPCQSPLPRRGNQFSLLLSNLFRRLHQIQLFPLCSISASSQATFASKLLKFADILSWYAKASDVASCTSSLLS